MNYLKGTVLLRTKPPVARKKLLEYEELKEEYESL